MKRFFSSLALLILPALAAPAGTTYYVATNGNDGAAGTAWATALATISNGLANAEQSANSLVLVSNGTYTLSAQLSLTNGVWLQGFGGASNTIINGNAATRCAYINNGILDGFTITNGYTNYGAGVYIVVTGQVWNCTISGNIATNYYGGGIYFNSGGVATNCRIIGNVATGTVAGTDARGGGAYCDTGGLLTNCLISLNVATPYPDRYSYGGGVYCSSAAGTVNNCLVYTNMAFHNGGGIYGGTVLNCVIVSNQANLVTNNNYGGGGCYGCTVVSNCTLIWNSGGGVKGSGGGAGNCDVVKNCTNISFNAARRGAGVSLSSSSANRYLLDSVIFSNWAGDAGAGVNIESGGVVSGCTVYGNSIVSGQGGGVYCYNWTAGFGPVITDCLISNNISSNSDGGGVYFTGYGIQVTGAVQRCTIVNNRTTGAAYGGGIYINTESILVQDCTLRNNFAGGYGGGIYSVNNTGVVERCEFFNNQALYPGGGGYFDRGVQVRNCLFAGNVATNAGYGGGGVYLDRIGNWANTNNLPPGGYLSSCTIVSNRGDYGGGLEMANTNNFIFNCVIQSNAAVTRGPDIYATTAEQSNSFWYCGTPTNLPAAQGNITNNPVFVDFTNANFRLTASSPCINTGTNQDWMADATDLDGSRRIINDRVEIGTYEYPLYLQVNPLAVTTTILVGRSDQTPVQLWSADPNVLLNWTATTNQAWLSLDASAGTIPAGQTNVLSIIHNATGQAPGSYSGQITLATTNPQSAFYPPPTQTVQAVMQVMNFGASPVVLTNNVLLNNTPPSQSFQIVSLGAGILTYAISTNAGWIAVDAGNGALTNAATNTVTVSYAPTAGWTPGVSNCALTVTAITPAGGAQTVAVILTVSVLIPPAGVIASAGDFLDRVRVTWTAMDTNTVGYTIWRSLSSDPAAAATIGSSAASPFDDFTAIPGTNYYYWVRGTNGASLSAFSASNNGYRALAAVTGVSASSGTYTDKIQLTWSANTNAHGYEVWRGPNAGVSAAAFLAGTAATCFNDYAVAQGAIYFYWVKATNSVTVSAFSASASGFRAMNPPAAIIATKGVHTTRVDVSWTVSANAASYEVWRGTTFNSDAALLIAAGVTATQYSDYAVAPAAIYYYWVKATNALSGSTFTTTNDWGYRALTPPGNVAASDAAYTNRIQVSWNESDGATGYEIYRGIGSESLSLLYHSGPSDRFYDDTAVAENVFYLYKVKAVTSRFASELSAGDTGYVLARPTGVVASMGQYVGRIRVSWNTVAGADRYEIWHNVLPLNGSAAKLGEAASVSYEDSSATAGQTHYYWVKARNSAAVSAFSTIVEGYSGTGYADLSVSNLVVLPANPGVGTHPAVVSFQLHNAGPEVLAAPNTAVRMTLYAATNPVLVSAAILGGVTQEVTLAAGATGVVLMPPAAIILPAATGAYYVFVSAFPTPPSRLVDSNIVNNTAIRTGTITVRAVGRPYAAVNDYDGDGISDLVVYRDGLWYIRTVDGRVLAYGFPFPPEEESEVRSQESEFSITAHWSPARRSCASSAAGGLLTANSFLPTFGDYDGDRKADPVVYNPQTGAWFALLSGSGYTSVEAQLGGVGYRAVPEDLDGDGRTDPVVYQTQATAPETIGTWQALLSAYGYTWASVRFPGELGFTPVPGDYDGDGAWDLAVYHESGYWYARTASGVLVILGEFWGGAGLRPAPGDFDGDGIWDLAVYQETTGYWYVRTVAGAVLAWEYPWGAPGCQPIYGDYDGDGRTDLAIYHEATGAWFVLSPAGTILLWNSSWGAPEYKPVTW